MNRLTKKIHKSAKQDIAFHNNAKDRAKKLSDSYEDNWEDIGDYLVRETIYNVLVASEYGIDLFDTLKSYYKGPSIRIWIPIVPPGVNATYGVNCKSKQKVYKTPQAKQWEKAAIMPIRAAANSVGFVVNPKNDRLIISIIIQGSKHDVDAPIKMIVDTVARTLGFDDKIVTNVHSSIDRENSERGVLIEIEKEIL